MSCVLDGTSDSVFIRVVRGFAEIPAQRCVDREMVSDTGASQFVVSSSGHCSKRCFPPARLRLNSGNVNLDENQLSLSTSSGGKFLPPFFWMRLFALGFSLPGLGLTFPSYASGLEDWARMKSITPSGYVCYRAGAMNIDFATRTNLDNTGDLKKDSPAKGVKDRYIFSIAVAKTTEFAGEVLRQPLLGIQQEFLPHRALPGKPSLLPRTHQGFPRRVLDRVVRRRGPGVVALFPPPSVERCQPAVTGSGVQPAPGVEFRPHAIQQERAVTGGRRVVPVLSLIHI